MGRPLGISEAATPSRTLQRHLREVPLVTYYIIRASTLFSKKKSKVRVRIYHGGLIMSSTYTPKTVNITKPWIDGHTIARSRRHGKVQKAQARASTIKNAHISISGTTSSFECYSMDTHDGGRPAKREKTRFGDMRFLNRRRIFHNHYPETKSACKVLPVILQGSEDMGQTSCES